MKEPLKKEIFKINFKRYIKSDNPIIFDVGCYDGKDSLEFCEIFPNSIIYAFEADERSIKLFKKVAGNDPRIQFNECALSDKDGFVEWYASDSETRRHYEFQENWSASSSIKEPDNHLNVFEDISFYKNKKVVSKRLDTWMKEQPQIDMIDVMWVDVNGGEEEFLNGAEKTLNKIKYLYIEFSGVGDKRLYKNCFTKDEIKNRLPNFKELGIYNFRGNFGNILLENQQI